MQKIVRANYGELFFVRTWINGNLHIGQLADGGFLHVAGVPVTSETELIDTIPQGRFLDAALEWFKNKDKVKPKQQKAKRLMLESDGSYVFEDGSPVTGVGDLVSALPQGVTLDAAVAWFVAKAKGIATDNVTEKDLNAAKTKEFMDTKFMCEVCGKVCKNQIGLNGHMRSHPRQIEEVKHDGIGISASSECNLC